MYVYIQYIYVCVCVGVFNFNSSVLSEKLPFKSGHFSFQDNCHGNNISTQIKISYENCVVLIGRASGHSFSFQGRAISEKNHDTAYIIIVAIANILDIQSEFH